MTKWTRQTRRPPRATTEPRAMIQQFALTITISLLAACASVSQAPAPVLAATSSFGRAAHACDPERDRVAIREMAGEFKVTFSFKETEALTQGYVPHAPHEVGATEVVALLEETDRKLVLQHVLLLDGPGGTPSPMKHWRQDWTFEDTELLEYKGRGAWEQRSLAEADAACAWLQAVFEVSDGPRYESFGRWVHEGTTSTWTSQQTWRPLPRREYTHRKDYDVLLGTNRHVVTPNGWTHEQDNMKWVLADGHALVRERGANTYERTSLPQAAVARTYLSGTAQFWGAVRDEWQRSFDANRGLTLLPEVDGKPLYGWLFPLAVASQSEDRNKRIEEARDFIRRFVRPVTPGPAALGAVAPRPAAGVVEPGKQAEARP